ncbi:hypothetical protein LCGC14_1635670 [marine sediment metagenome]|uniref:Uncharacterized protein n=1 Tax=marine sediment metagenome TaxID=412755 RepID=A0A0F9INI0_9ZZZZ
MSHQHHDHVCKHDNLNFCKKCHVPYCEDCGYEWAEKCTLNHDYWQYPFYTTYQPWTPDYGTSTAIEYPGDSTPASPQQTTCLHEPQDNHRLFGENILDAYHAIKGN